MFDDSQQQTEISETDVDTSKGYVEYKWTGFPPCFPRLHRKELSSTKHDTKHSLHSTGVEGDWPSKGFFSGCNPPRMCKNKLIHVRSTQRRILVYLQEGKMMIKYKTHFLSLCTKHPIFIFKTIANNIIMYISSFNATPKPFSKYCRY